MSTLHILRSEPDQQTLELIRAVTPGEGETFSLHDESPDYAELVEEIFSHEHVISWW